MRAAWLTMVALCACEPALPEGWPPVKSPLGVDGGADAGLGYVTVVADGGGFRALIDSTDVARWVAVDLDAPAEVPFEGDGWDLAFQRFHVRARGGASGDGGVAITFTDAGYSPVGQSPPGPWLVDLADGDDENADLDTVLDKEAVWYEYEPRFHTLSPRALTYVVRTDRGGYVKLKFDGYYDRSGTPGWFALRFAPVLPPP
ncbi:MAG: HmuY family protein [Myxococcaceae bacterium]|nr:HmuY family protein [Myxococcaceae bacterium]